MKITGITIEERKGKGGRTSYRAKFFEKGARKSLTFKTRTDAESFARILQNAQSIPSDIKITGTGIIQQIRFQEVCWQLNIDVDKAYKEAIDILTKRYSQTEGKSITVKEAVKKFISSCQKAYDRSASIKEYKTYLGWLVKSFGDEYPVKSITEDDIRGIINERDKISVREHYLMRLKTFFNFLKREKFLEKNPASDISLPKVKKDECPPKILTVDEVRTIFQKLPNDPSVLACFALLAFAGVRPEELCPKDNAKARITWEDIDFTNHTINIPGAVSKIRKQRSIAGRFDNLWQFLELVPEEKRKGYVCNFSYSKMRKIRRKVIGKGNADILRHCFASYGYHYLGAEITIEIMGHIRGYQTFEKHYKGIANENDAKAYFSITPSTLQNEKKQSAS